MNPSIKLSQDGNGVAIIYKHQTHERGLYIQTLVMGTAIRKFSFMKGIRSLWGMFFYYEEQTDDVVIKEKKII